MRVKNKGATGALVVEPEEQMIDQGGLPGPGFTGQKHQTLAALDAIGQFVKGAPGLGCQVKIRRVRVYVEWILLKPKKTLVHESITHNRSTLGPGDVGRANREHTLP
jgi:hypothetical protein